MIRPSNNSISLSSNRQDDLLKRLKQCVGGMQGSSKNDKRTSSITSNSIKKYTSQQLKPDQDSFRQKIPESLSKQSSENFLVYDKQNRIDRTKINFRENNDYKQSLTNSKHDYDILKLTKTYLSNTQQNNRVSYQTDRETSLPLAEVSNISNVKRELFNKQTFDRKPLSVRKDASDSTKKRIAQRQSLINDDRMQKYTPQKIAERQRYPSSFNQDDFLQRLSLRKNNYLNEVKENKQERLYSTKNEYPSQSLLTSKSITRQQQRIPQNKSLLQSSTKRNQISSSRVPSQKYENYSKIAMENLVKEIDFRKAEKMQKLKKITNMNEDINNRIRKIVDTFENYLTYRQS